METRTAKNNTKTVRKIISRSCSICGGKMKVTVFTDRSYAPGHYFFKMRVRGKNAEYWECDKCYEYNSEDAISEEL